MAYWKRVEASTTTRPSPCWIYDTGSSCLRMLVVSNHGQSRTAKGLVGHRFGTLYTAMTHFGGRPRSAGGEFRNIRRRYA